MAPAMISGLTQPNPLFSGSEPGSPSQEKKVATSPVAAQSGEGKPVAVDTVSISDQSRQAVMNLQNEATRVEGIQKEKAKKKEETAVASTDLAKSAVSKVEFTYDVNGELVVKYMDTADRLVYQVPSELMLNFKKTAQKSASSLDTKV